MMNDDMELVGEYAARQSEPAFETLVTRHAGLVYSAALRHVQDPHLAAEITQTVFIILGRKAGSLGPKTILPGWLYRTTRYTACAALKMQQRRERREQEAYMQATTPEPQDDTVWEQLSPLLDQAMTQLRDKDHDAIVLRYFQNRNLREVGAALGVDEYAAQKRVSRALEKLRSFFTKRGVSSTTAVIAAALSAHSVHAAPAVLTQTLLAGAAAHGAATSLSTPTLIKGALKLMAWTKAKTIVAATAGILFAAGTATIAVKQWEEHRTYAWQGQEGLFSPQFLNAQPPQVKIVPSRFTSFAEGSAGNKMMGTGLPAEEVVAAAFGSDAARTFYAAELPKRRYDYIASLPNGNQEALQRAVEAKFGVRGQVETRNADVLLLRMKSPGASALKATKKPGNWYMLWRDSGTRLEFGDQPLLQIAQEFEALLKMPVLDQTGTTNHFDFDLHCSQRALMNRQWDIIHDALDQFGLELVVTNLPIDMLVVDRAK